MKKSKQQGWNFTLVIFDNDHSEWTYPEGAPDIDRYAYRTESEARDAAREALARCPEANGAKICHNYEKWNPALKGEDSIGYWSEEFDAGEDIWR